MITSLPVESPLYAIYRRDSEALKMAVLAAAKASFDGLNAIDRQNLFRRDNGVMLQQQKAA